MFTSEWTDVILQIYKREYILLKYQVTFLYINYIENES